MCISKYQSCQARPTLVDINSHKTLFYPFTVIANECGGSCNTINDPYAWVCVTNKIKNLNVKVFHLISGVNKTRFLVQHESSDCKCGLSESVCNSKQKWNHDKLRCKCKELVDWSSSQHDYMWNPGVCDCDCNKAGKIEKYLDIKNC